MKTAIIGGGASGLICAIIASRLGKSVVVFERQKSCGKKILATGNGRCNITNQNLEPHQYNNQKFVKNLFDMFSLQNTTEFFSSIGLEFITDKKPFRLYPQSLQASSVVKLLLFEAEKLGIDIKYNTTIESIKQKDNLFVLKTSKRVSYKFDKVVLATGSIAHSLGLDTGYKIAKNLSHNIIEQCPSLVGLISNDIYCASLDGVKIDTKVSMTIDHTLSHTVYGDVLFTSYGLSGLAILELSRFLPVDKSIDTYITIDLFDDMTTDELSLLFENRVKIIADKPHGELLVGLVHEKFMELIAPKDSFDIMAYKLKNLKFHILDTREFKYAEVCRGGVDTNDINPNTLMSNKVPNLYFCGEVLDIDGNCGGYNLQFAWSSGAVVAQNI